MKSFYDVESNEKCKGAKCLSGVMSGGGNSQARLALATFTNGLCHAPSLFFLTETSLHEILASRKLAALLTQVCITQPSRIRRGGGPHGSQISNWRGILTFFHFPFLA